MTGRLHLERVRPRTRAQGENAVAAGFRGEVRGQDLGRGDAGDFLQDGVAARGLLTGADQPAAYGRGRRHHEVGPRLREVARWDFDLGVDGRATRDGLAGEFGQCSRKRRSCHRGRGGLGG